MSFLFQRWLSQMVGVVDVRQLALHTTVCVIGPKLLSRIEELENLPPKQRSWCPVPLQTPLWLETPGGAMFFGTAENVRLINRNLQEEHFHRLRQGWTTVSNYTGHSSYINSMLQAIMSEKTKASPQELKLKRLQQYKGQPTPKLTYHVLDYAKRGDTSGERISLVGKRMRRHSVKGYLHAKSGRPVLPYQRGDASLGFVLKDYKFA